MPLFSFNLGTCHITDTRSAHKDTDYVSFTLKIGSAAPQNVSKPMGDLNNGTFNIGLTHPGINILPDTPVVLNYLIINAGTSPAATVKATLETLGSRLANVPSFNLPPLVSSLQLVATKFADELSPIINSTSCDGLVAAEQNTFAYDELLSGTSQTGFITQTTSHTGTKARSGCNSKPSAYVVHWSIMHAVVVPNVIGMQLGKPGATGTAAQTLLQASLQGMPKSGDPNSPVSEVIRQKPEAGQLAAIGSIVQLETIIGR